MLEHLQAVVQVDRPEWFAPFGERVATPDVVDEDIEAFVLALDAGCKFFNFGGDGVIDADGDAAATGGGDEFGGFFYCFRAGGVFLEIFSGAAASAVDGGTGLAESDGNAASGAASGSGYEGDFALQGFIGELPRGFGHDWIRLASDFSLGVLNLKA